MNANNANNGLANKLIPPIVSIRVSKPFWFLKSLISANKLLKPFDLSVLNCCKPTNASSLCAAISVTNFGASCKLDNTFQMKHQTSAGSKIKPHRMMLDHISDSKL